MNRALVFARKQCEGKVPEKADLEAVDTEFLEKIRSLCEDIAEAYEQFRLRKACRLVMELAQEGNVYFNSKEPWKDAKDPERVQRMRNTVACCVDALKLLAMVSAPVVPETAQKVWAMINDGKVLADFTWAEVLDLDLTGNEIPKPQILFRKIEDEEVEEEIAKLHANSESLTVS